MMAARRILHVADPATSENPAVGPLATFCGRDTESLTLWASPELTDRTDFLPGTHHRIVCEIRKAARARRAE